MESIFWNVRGSNGADKQLELSRFLKTHKPSFVSLLETKLDNDRLRVFHMKLDSLKSSFLTDGGRICIHWNSHLVHVTILESSTQHVHCLIQCKRSQRTFHSTSVYDSNLYPERHLLWNSIINLSTGLQNSPWIVGGDFNEVRYNSEKSGGRPVHARRIRKFNCYIESSGLQDLKAFGHILSWNNRQESRIMCRLDRALKSSGALTSKVPHRSKIVDVNVMEDLFRVTFFYDGYWKPVKSENDQNYVEGKQFTKVFDRDKIVIFGMISLNGQRLAENEQTRKFTLYVISDDREVHSGQLSQKSNTRTQSTLVDLQSEVQQEVRVNEDMAERVVEAGSSPRVIKHSN
ncbi:hypothetical protein QJS10_CPB17g00346 [Acorus calamus]|uniref:Endonuclease/exonuclease/phosphatase domain-containing protein n=1 Tax=Acorus calamus TaxID=4465 RepID=A0AAV9CXB3_ACOCL|nr:hypothetical protein QJS10_CPB17g00346 [Acorus calamus]